MNSSFTDAFDGLVLDADGVIYRGPEPVPYAIEALVEAVRTSPWCVVTNNAANPPGVVSAKLTGFGLEATADNIVTSPHGALAFLIDAGFEPGSKVFVVGGPGIEEALIAGGFVPVRDRHDGPVAVVQGLGMDVGWHDLAEASYAIADGAMWVATNLDPSLPTQYGLAPGNGALVAAVAEAVGRRPDAVTGKPEPLLFELAAQRMDAVRPLVVGDRLDTDIEGANRAGMNSLLVLTGVTTVDELSLLAEVEPLSRPRYLAADLRCLAGSPGDVEICERNPLTDDPLDPVRVLLHRIWSGRVVVSEVQAEWEGVCRTAAEGLRSGES
jgi:glycerol 3-phosphatase-2